MAKVVEMFPPNLSLKTEIPKNTMSQSANFTEGHATGSPVQSAYNLHSGREFECKWGAIIIAERHVDLTMNRQ